MLIQEIKANKIIPFEVDDIKLIKIFSFFLHLAPTIESSSATNIPESKLNNNWNEFIQKFNKNSYYFIHPDDKIENYINQSCLNNNSVVNRKTKGFICKRKNIHEKDYECILRHIRNSIAHNNVFLFDARHRKYILFEDFNNRKNKNAIILLSQADLNRLKKVIIK